MILHCLGHGSDQHLRKPTPTKQGLRGKRVVHVVVGALHCLAVTDTGEVLAWGDNVHGSTKTLSYLDLKMLLYFFFKF